jgi:hypothetical protein
MKDFGLLGTPKVFAQSSGFRVSQKTRFGPIRFSLRPDSQRSAGVLLAADFHARQPRSFSRPQIWDAYLRYRRLLSAWPV